MKCMYCGKPVRKNTVTVYLEKERSPLHRNEGHTRHVYPDELGIPWPKTMAECQKLTNLKVVSIERGAYYKDAGNQYTREHTEEVRKFTTWDGEHYLPSYGYFCTNNCAGWFAQRVIERMKTKVA